MLYAFLAGMLFPTVYLVGAGAGLWFSLRQRAEYPRSSKSAIIGFSCILVIGVVSASSLLIGVLYLQGPGAALSPGERVTLVSQLEQLGWVWNLCRNILTVFAFFMIARAVFLDRSDVTGRLSANA